MRPKGDGGCLTKNVVVLRIVGEVWNPGDARDAGEHTNTENEDDGVLRARGHLEIPHYQEWNDRAGQVGEAGDQGKGIAAYEDDFISTARA